MDKIIIFIMGFIVGAVFIGVIMLKNQKPSSNSVERNKKMANIMNQWLILKHNDMCVADKLEEYGIHKVGIYGMGIMGRHLIRELENSEIQIMYAFDRKKMSPFHGIEVHRLTENVINVDAVINTVLLDETQVESLIRHYYDGMIISLEKLIFESYQVD